MKKNLSLLFCLLVPAALYAQDCTRFIYLQKGKTIETTTFTAAGDVIAKRTNHILDVSTANGITTATAEVENFDRAGRSSGKNTVTYKCDGGTFYFDMSAMGADKVKMSASNMEFPAGMKVGDHLKDMDIKMHVARPGTPGRDMSIKITNVQVVAKESVTTPAGTWDALKITYETKMDMPGMNMPSQITTEWFVPNFGIVQWELGRGLSMKITAIH